MSPVVLIFDYILVQVAGKRLAGACGLTSMLTSYMTFWKLNIVNLMWWDDTCGDVDNDDDVVLSCWQWELVIITGDKLEDVGYISSIRKSVIDS